MLLSSSSISDNQSTQSTQRTNPDSLSFVGGQGEGYSGVEEGGEWFYCRFDDVLSVKVPKEEDYTLLLLEAHSGEGMIYKL